MKKIQKILLIAAVLTVLFAVLAALVSCKQAAPGGETGKTEPTQAGGESGATESEKTTEVHEHTFGEWTAEKTATCTEEGVEARACACGEKETRAIPATGHHFGQPVFTWTDIEATAERLCPDCGTAEELTVTVTSEVTGEPSCVEEGETTYTATLTIDESTYTDRQTQPIPALGHDPANGICARCGEILLKTGDRYVFGSYEQDNDASNGKEAIEWIVLDVKDGKALLLSKYALDCQKYHYRFAGRTWEACSLRTWLNDSFYNAAFSAEEQEKIVSTELTNNGNEYYGVEGGNATTDKVFLPDLEDLVNVDYGFSNDSFKFDEARRCQATEYAKAQGCKTNTTAAGSYYGNCWWWLRSPGFSTYYISGVNSGGRVDFDGNSADTDTLGVRPALWIELQHVTIE